MTHSIPRRWLHRRPRKFFLRGRTICKAPTSYKTLSVRVRGQSNVLWVQISAWLVLCLRVGRRTKSSLISKRRVVPKLTARADQRAMFDDDSQSNRRIENKKSRIPVFTYDTSTHAPLGLCSYAVSHVPTRISSERGTCVLCISPCGVSESRRSSGDERYSV